MTGERVEANPRTERRSATATEARARHIGHLSALGVVIIIALVFTALSAHQILLGAAEVSVRELPQAPRGTPLRLCADGVRSLALDLSLMGDVDALRSQEAAKFALDWEAVANACAQSSAGLDAWASLRRLEEAARQLPPTSREELTGLRRNVFAHLPVELR